MRVRAEITTDTVRYSGHQAGLVAGIRQHGIDHRGGRRFAVGSGHANNLQPTRRKTVDRVINDRFGHVPIRRRRFKELSRNNFLNQPPRIHNSFSIRPIIEDEQYRCYLP